ncbi:SLC13 family permease [Streptococcus danieliae]|uniref:SLC13 family permease n=2 Tax=Streptococcus acidominimus TaxID=1326 RepID=A0A4Y9FKW3_STRAI|nr:SLC13 family permease [Streptococcus acidominimus]MBF0838276.1 SLC13 family permease [Streptococcus acidominimus]MBF0846711.1 SLC13 family permease [Streptococcus danieliae]TFU29824.1 SLC13 family permease [Streptococcus acidominimus]
MNMQWKKQGIARCLGLGVLILAYLHTLFGWHLFGLSSQTFAALATLVGSLILWLFVATDWPSLLTLVSLGLIPEMTYGQVSQWSFGNTTFVFLLFTFVMTYALNQTSFLKRVTSKVVHSRFAMSRPSRFITAFLGVVLLLSSAISPTVIFMFLLPLFEEICLQFGWKKGDQSASHLLIAMFITIAIGTAITPINHVFAITAMGLYTAMSKVAISNLQYMQFAVPAGLALFLVLLFSVRFLFKIDTKDIQMKELDSLTALEPVDKREKWIVGLFLGMVAMWLVPEILVGALPAFATFFKQAGIMFPPLLMTAVLALLNVEGKPLLNISEALSKGVHWPSMLLVGSTLALGTVLSNEKVGVVALLNEQLSPVVVGLSPIFMVVFFVVWAGVQTNFTSNLVTVSVVTTMALTLYQSAGTQFTANIAVICCAIGYMASLAFVTAPAMPYVAISIGSDWTNSRDTFLFGCWMLLWSSLSAIAIFYPLGVLVLP